MADSHPYSWKVRLPVFGFRIPQKWLQPSIIVQAIGAAAVVVGLLLTAHQIKKSTDAANAQNIYAAEKDFSSLFGAAGKSEQFQACFGEAANVPRGCISRDARQIFYEMLQHYRLLGIMASKDAVPTTYYEFRLEGFCPYARSASAKVEFEELLKKNRLEKGLWSDLNRICKM